MRNELKNIEKIELYITNQLPEVERLSFEQEMSKNSILGAQVEAHKLLLQAIKRKQLRSEIAAIGSGTSFAKWKLWGLGGTLFIVLLIALLFNNNQPKDLVEVKNEKVEQLENPTQILPAVKLDSLTTSEPLEQDSLEQGGEDVTNNTKTTYKSKPIVYSEDTECGGLKTFVAPDIQHFEVEALQGKTIEGKQGTLVIIPSNAFLNDQNQMVSGAVDFELVEALTLEDMVLYNLTTTSNGKLLETGGMFYMNATQNGKQLKINPNRPIYTETPTETKKKGMLAFDSEIDSAGNINWINPKPLKKYLTKIDLNLLDFLPNGFANGVEESLPYKNHKKATSKLVDSLYYSLGEVGSEIESDVLEKVESDFSNKKQNVLLKQIKSVAYLAKETVKRINKKETGVAKGNIVDKKDNPIVNAKIQIKLEEYVFNTYSDLNGDIYFYNVTPGTYVLEVSHSKFENYKEDVLIVNGKTTIPQIRLKEKTNFPCGINPLSIKTIKTPKFEQTYLATNEMEERIKALHQLNNGDSLLQIYIENLGNNLFVADSIVMQALNGKEKAIFKAFYQQKLTDLKDVNNIYQKQLSDYYNKKKKQYSKELNKLKGKLAQKSQEELEELQRKIAQNTKDYLKASKPKTSPKQMLNRSFGSIEQSMPRRSVATTNSYPAQWSSFGWKNIDAYLHLLNKGAETVIITSSKKAPFNRMFQYLNTIKTLTPLLIDENTSLAKFPKRGSKEAKLMQRTYCFNIAKENGKYYWGKQHFNPYQQSNITLTSVEMPLHKIREELKIAGREGVEALNFFEKNIKASIKFKKEQAKRMERIKVEAEQRAELLKIYKAEQAKLKLEIERKKQIRQAEERFINKLRAIAFPCERDEEVQDKEDELNISAPNKFYPNSDGANTTFIVRADAKIKSYKMVITNSKGKVLYSTKSMDKPWKGRKANSKMYFPNGVYMWSVEIVDSNGKEAKYNGVVELINGTATNQESSW